MSIVLIKEGNRYRMEPEMDPSEMPDVLNVVDGEIKWPSHAKIWAGMLNPQAAVELQKFIDETDDDGKQK